MDAEAIAELLGALVDTPSVTGEESAIAGFVAARLERRATGECRRSGDSVIWRGPRRGRPLVVLAGHLDTVPPRGNERARRDGDRLYGLGATDMKGGDAVMLALLETQDPARLRFDLAAVFYDGEEGPYDIGMEEFRGGIAEEPARELIREGDIPPGIRFEDDLRE